MSETPPDLRDSLLKKISDQLTWIVVLLVLIMFNTCSLSDDLSDAARDLRTRAQHIAQHLEGLSMGDEDQCLLTVATPPHRLRQQP